MCEAWGLVEMGKHLSTRRESSSAVSRTVGLDRSLATPSPSFSEDRSGEHNLVLILLQTTTSAVRSVQRYFLSLPPDKLPYSPAVEQAHRREPSSSSGRPATLGVITSARPIDRYSTLGRRSISPPRVATAPQGHAEDDPLLRLRKASLATLGALKEMDVRYRLSATDTSDEELASALDTVDLSSGSVTIDRTSSSESGSSSAGTGLTGYLYNDDVTLSELRAEANAIKYWIETVDSLLFAKTAEAVLKSPRPSSGSGHLQIAMDEADSVPRWAREGTFSADLMGECYEICEIIEES